MNSKTSAQIFLSLYIILNKIKTLQSLIFEGYFKFQITNVLYKSDFAYLILGTNKLFGNFKIKQRSSL